MSSFDYVEFPQACGATWEEIQESEVSFSKGFCWAGLIKRDKKVLKNVRQKTFLSGVQSERLGVCLVASFVIVWRVYPDFCLSLLAGMYKNRHK